MGTKTEREWICYSLCTDKIRDWKISRYGDCLRTKTIVKLCEGKAFPEYTQELDVIGNDFSLLLYFYIAGVVQRQHDRLITYRRSSNLTPATSPKGHNVFIFFKQVGKQPIK